MCQPLPQEGGVGVAADKVAAAPQHQGLVQRSLELVVALLDVTVLVAFTGLDGLAHQAVMFQQGLVALLEGLGPLDAWLDGRGQSVGTVHGRHTAQFPQGILQALAEALQALGKTNRSRLPVGVGEHEVVDHVGKRAAVDGHVQVGTVGEVAGSQSAGVMDLAEEDFLGWPALGAPAFEASLQGPQLAVGEGAGIAPLQIGEEGFSLQAGVEPQLLFELRPDIGKRIGSSSPVPVHAFDLGRQLAQSAILAGRLGVHAGAGRGRLFASAAQIKATKLTHLQIGDHREPPCQGSQWCTDDWPWRTTRASPRHADREI